MGTSSHLVTLIMKFLLALSSLLALTAAEWTCDDCTAVVGALATYLSSEESIDNQVAILLAEVCPQAENPDECVEQELGKSTAKSASKASRPQLTKCSPNHLSMEL